MLKPEESVVKTEKPVRKQKRRTHMSIDTEKRGRKRDRAGT